MEQFFEGIALLKHCYPKDFLISFNFAASSLAIANSFALFPKELVYSASDSLISGEALASPVPTPLFIRLHICQWI